LSNTLQADQHRATPAGESAGQSPNRVFERYTVNRLTVLLAGESLLMPMVRNVRSAA
jgi:hypothetical protein